MIERYTRKKMREIWSDENKWQQKLRTELVVLDAKAELGLIPKEGAAHIRKNAGFTLKRINEIDKEIEHDLNAFLRAVRERLDPKYAGLFHQGLTSYDAEEPETALRMTESIDLIEKGVLDLMRALKKRAREHKDTKMLGRTHGQPSGITTLALKFLNYYYDLKQDLQYLHLATDTINYGKISGMIGTYSTVDPQVEKLACEKLGIKPADISTQIISRNRHAFVIAVLAITAANLEKMAEDIRFLGIPEIGEVREPFKKKQMGSSARAHKKNPVICERICGLARIIRGYVYPVIENINTWLERDITQSSTERIIFADSFQLLDYILDKMIWVIKGLEVSPDRMEENIERTYGTIASQDITILLTNEGMDSQKAYRAVQRLSFQAVSKRTQLEPLLLADKETGPWFVNAKTRLKFHDCFDWEKHLENVDAIYERFGI